MEIDFSPVLARMKVPQGFDPKKFDAGQWVAAARDAGLNTIILRARAEDGFCLWPSAGTRHSVASSPWRGGKGDVVEDLSKAAVVDHMTSDPYALKADAPITHAMHLMSANGFRHLPLVDDDFRPEGIISFRDVARFFSEKVI